MKVYRKIQELFSSGAQLKAIAGNMPEKGRILDEFEVIKINQAVILNNMNLLFKKEEILQDIKKSEFKVFSQWGDDGIISFLINYLDIKEKKFIEFGVENYTECNTKLLLKLYNWEGLIIDGSLQNMDAVRNSDLYWKYTIKALNQFVTAENINGIITENGFAENTGLLHIDIDGNDYWVWKAIDTVRPPLVIVEYNSLFGFDLPYTIPYQTDFIRTGYHYSNLYYGTSLLSLCDLAEEKGYYFTGCNSNGNNAYFVRKDAIKGLKIVSPEEGYVNSKFSESRDQNGKLTHLRGAERIKAISGLEVFNTRTNKLEKI
jgi:hypothetical protein